MMQGNFHLPYRYQGKDMKVPEKVLEWVIERRVVVHIDFSGQLPLGKGGQLNGSLALRTLPFQCLVFRC